MDEQKEEPQEKQPQQPPANKSMFDVWNEKRVTSPRDIAEEVREESKNVPTRSLDEELEIQKQRLISEYEKLFSEDEKYFNFEDRDRDLVIEIKKTKNKHTSPLDRFMPENYIETKLRSALVSVRPENIISVETKMGALPSYFTVTGNELFILANGYILDLDKREIVKENSIHKWDGEDMEMFGVDPKVLPVVEGFDYQPWPADKLEMKPGDYEQLRSILEGVKAGHFKLPEEYIR